ncbi:Resolvase domain protein [Niastella koreensis GR20-10]|uniref:Resolvase domain protein n=3 Tax=Niastella koreensis TaxID=354356 RepID=G8TJI3_NIAKG|nr:recombinase family protein [Niastella koreensis]AEV99718.1 Resolvase domain protein [Niastella koreensis GR20-10]
MKIPAVEYHRVSRERQSEEGYGLDASKADIHSFLMSHDKYEVHKVFVEVECGDRNNRPELAKALNYCKRHKAVLLVAKLDRLSRRVSMISMLLESNIQFWVVAYPTINPKENPFFFQMLAIAAELELKHLRERTKAGLAVAKSKGVILGCNGKVLAEKNKKAADDFALHMSPELLKAKAEGLSLRATAENWNYRHIPTARGNGCQWDATTVYHLSKRIERISNNQTV